MANTALYVDGFNLYYGIRNTGYKWLDLSALCGQLLPSANITAIKYFTAIVTARPTDPQQQIRQLTYLRALGTIPTVSIYRGHFLTNPTSLPLEAGYPNQITTVRVMKTEEKGSDVNLASHLIVDGFKGAYDEAWVLTNDSDLCEPIKLVKGELGLRVGVMNPKPYLRRSRALGGVIGPADFIQITLGHLAASQFPATMTDANGTITKPASW